MSLENKYTSNFYVQMLVLIFISFILTYFVQGDPSDKEKSLIKYANPKYVGDTQLSMFRRKRNEQFKTNVTVTSFHKWGNNITLQISYPTKDDKIFKMSSKVCDLLNKVWVLEILRVRSNITECPMNAGTYAFYNLGVVPKALPPPVPTNPKSSAAIVNITYIVTATKEIILDVQLRAHVKD